MGFQRSAAVIVLLLDGTELAGAILLGSGLVWITFCSF